jgi:chemotaxis protein MotB
MTGERDDTLLEDEGAGYLISVSDIMAGLLFIFMVTLVAFVINFQEATDLKEREQALAEEKQRRAELERDRARAESEYLKQKRDELTNARRLRREMLEDIETRLRREGIRVEVDHDHGVLRLTENAILFPSGRAELGPAERAKLDTIGGVLMDVLPCYAGGPPPGCAPGTANKLEAVFVEGHTDNIPIRGGTFHDNWELSAHRAMYTYRLLADFHSGVAELSNELGQPMFSVSGYGEGRPVVDHPEPIADPRNRRIDLRFIMTPPKAGVEPEPLRRAREQGVR